MKQEIPIILRPATESDIGFIFNSWLKSYRSSAFAKSIINEVYFENHHKIIERLVQENQVIIACDEKDSNQFYGYICAGKVQDHFICHYMYVKHSFRGLGIGTELLNYFDHDIESISIYTHHTRICDKVAEKYNFVYMPYLAFKEV